MPVSLKEERKRKQLVRVVSLAPKLEGDLTFTLASHYGERWNSRAAKEEALSILTDMRDRVARTLKVGAK